MDDTIVEYYDDRKNGTNIIRTDELYYDKLNQLHLILLFTYLTLHHRVTKFTEYILPHRLHELEHSDNEDERIVYLNQYNGLVGTINNLPFSELYPLFGALFIIDTQTIIDYNIINHINPAPNICFEVITTTGNTGWDYLQNTPVPLTLSVIQDILRITQIFSKNNDTIDENNKTEIIENMMRQAPCLAKILQKYTTQKLEHLETIHMDIYSLYEAMVEGALEADENQKQYPYRKSDAIISILVAFRREDNHSWDGRESAPHFLAKMIDYFIQHHIEPMEKKLRVLSTSQEATGLDDIDIYRSYLFQYATGVIIAPQHGYTYSKYTSNIFYEMLVVCRIKLQSLCIKLKGMN